jgi:hypothetical protein
MEPTRKIHPVAEAAMAFARKIVESLGALRYTVPSIVLGCEIFKI